MLVDDDTDDIEIFREALKEVDETAHFISARDGVEALSLLLADNVEKPDLIFLDLNMPKLNGKQCLKILKKDPELNNIPVIIYTTSKLDEDKEETNHLGASSFITKPNTFMEIRKTIAVILENIRLHQ